MLYFGAVPSIQAMEARPTLCKTDGMTNSMIYVTAADRDEALNLARTVVSERLAACANLLGPITSVYWWNGSVNEGDEVALVLKTRADLVEKLTERLKALHSYECPCVVALPITGGNPAFLEWIGAETQGSQDTDELCPSVSSTPISATTPSP